LTATKTVTGLTRGVSYLTGTTSVSLNQHTHRVGANVKITDYPLLQILRAILNGNDFLPNLLRYVSGTDCTVSSPGDVICDKEYTDTRVSAGAANANETTAGLVELATAAEAGAGTSIGGTAARLALGANLATSTCQASG